MKLVKYFWVLSILLFLGTAMYIYAWLPEQVEVLFNEKGETTAWLTKNDFFYSIMASMLFINILFTVIGNSVLYLPKSLVWIINSNFWLKKENQKEMMKRLKGWTRGLAAIINMLLLIWVIMIFSKVAPDVPNLSNMVYVFAVLFVVWILAYFPIFNRLEYTHSRI